MAHPSHRIFDRVARGCGWLIAVGIPAAFLTVFFLLPTGTLVSRGFIGADGGWDLTGFSDVLTRARTWRVIVTTIAMSTVATLICLVLALPGSWILYRTRFPGRTLMRAIVAIPFVLPSVVVGVCFRALLSEGAPLGFLHWDGTATAVIVGMVFFNYSLAVRTIGQLWVRLDPRTEQAAAALGASPIRVFATVTLIRLTPAIASAGIMVFLFCASSFGLVLILGGTRIATVETEIYFLTTGILDLRSASVLSIVQLVVIGACLAFASLTRRASDGGGRLRTDLDPRPLTFRDIPAMITTILVVVGLIAAPLANLVWRSLHRDSQLTLANYSDLFDDKAVRILGASVISSVGRSLTIAVVATLTAVFIGSLVAIAVTRRPRTRRGKLTLRMIDAAFMLPIGISAVTVGFGFLIALDHPPIDLRGSWWLIPMAQTMVAIPLVVRIVTPVFASLDPRQLDAARVLGASPLRVLIAVEVPYVWRSIAVGAAFAFAMSLGEFGATAFLARPATPTLPVAVYRLIGEPSAQAQGMALAASVLLAVLAGASMVLVEARSARTGISSQTRSVSGTQTGTINE